MQEMFESYFNHKILKTVQVVPFIRKLHKKRSLLQIVEPCK
jgi:hypothetical protein